MSNFNLKKGNFNKSLVCIDCVYQYNPVQTDYITGEGKRVTMTVTDEFDNKIGLWAQCPQCGSWKLVASATEIFDKFLRTNLTDSFSFRILEKINLEGATSSDFNVGDFEEMVRIIDYVPAKLNPESVKSTDEKFSDPKYKAVKPTAGTRRYIIQSLNHIKAAIRGCYITESKKYLYVVMGEGYYKFDMETEANIEPDPILILLSHTLTQVQKDELKGMGYSPTFLKPEDQKVFSQIDPSWTMDQIRELANQILSSYKYSSLMIGGELSLMISIVEQAKVPLFIATTKRVVVETKMEDGSIKKDSIFDHVQFRRIK